MEKWLPYPEDSRYEASSLGRVRSLNFNPPLVMKQTWSYKKGKPRYLYVTFGKKKVSVHYVIARTFIGPRPAGLLIMHLDETHDNNAATNLQYGTFDENQKRHYEFVGKCKPMKIASVPHPVGKRNGRYIYEW